MRVVLVIAAVLIGLMGLQSALAGLYVLFSGRDGLGGIIPLAVGGAFLWGGWLILRSQLGQNGEDDEMRRRRLRTGVRILLTVLALLLGLAGLLVSLCGVIFGDALGKGSAGWFVAIGVVLVAVAILLIAKARWMRQRDRES